MYKSATLEPQLAMGSEPYQLQRICIRIAVAQHEIGAETVSQATGPMNSATNSDFEDW